MKSYIEERAVNVANYIIENNATVRQTAKKFGISKSMVHPVVLKWNMNGTLALRVDIIRNSLNVRKYMKDYFFIFYFSTEIYTVLREKI